MMTPMIEQRHTGIKLLIISVLMPVFSACSLLPSNDQTLTQAKQDSQSISQWQNSYKADEQFATTLNELINAPQLNALIQQALKANPNFQQTVITLKQLQAQEEVAFGARLPTVEGGFSAGRNEAQGTKKISNSYTGSASVSWELDLWGKLADADAAAIKNIEAQDWAVQAARDTLVANVCKAWLSLIAMKNNIKIYQTEISVYERQMKYTVSRYRSGLSTTLEDLDTVKTSLASTKATLESEKRSFAEEQRSLAVLLGQTTVPDIELGDYPKILLPIAQLPSQTLQARPDLREAYSNIESKNFSSKVAYKDMLPSISLSATLNDIASTPSQALFKDPVWSLLGQLTAPLYEGGQLKAQAKVADLDVALAYQNYRSTLLTAVQDVENALFAEKSLNLQYQHVSSALVSAKRSLEHYHEKYRQGLVDLLDVIAVQQKTFALKVQQENLAEQRLSNRVTLGLALGLSWKVSDKDKASSATLSQTQNEGVSE